MSLNAMDAQDMERGWCGAAGAVRMVRRGWCGAAGAA